MTMYVARRTGGGRGVYEIAGSTTTGLTSVDLLGREIVFDLAPDLQLFTGVVLDVQGGKHRLRMAGANMQIQRQLASALMMPSPRRVNDTGSSQRVLTNKEYVIERIHIEFANHLLPDRAFVLIGSIETRNLLHEVTIRAQQRVSATKQIWDNHQRLPEPLDTLIQQHQQLVSGGQPIGIDCEQTVSKIQRAANQLWPDEIGADADALPVVSAQLGLSELAIGDTSLNSNQIADFDLGNLVSIPRRTRRVMIERRGQWSFRRGLLTAYDGRCQITRYTGEPALEAAHIVPYSTGGDYTNDLRNGLLLRADIHTLFDLGLLKVTPGSLEVRIMDPLQASSYASLHGTVLQTGANIQPSDEALAHKWETTVPQ